MEISVLASVGYGLFFSAMPTGIVGITFLANHTADLVGALVLLGAYLAATAVPLPIGGFVRRGPLWLAVLLSSVGIIAGFLLVFALPKGSPVTIVGPVFMGLAASPLRGLWYRRFFEIYRGRGRDACIFVVALSFLVFSLPSLLSQGVSAGGLSEILLVLALIIASSVCLVVQEYRAIDEEHRLGGRQKTYELSRYTSVLLVGFGLIWGLICSCPLLLSQMGLVGRVGFIPVAAVLLGLVWLWLVRSRSEQGLGIRFGYLVRCVVALAGCAWAAAPLLVNRSLVAIAFIMSVVYIAQYSLMILFSIEICAQRNLGIEAVGATNYRAFALAATVGVGAFIAVDAIASDARATFELLALIAVIASLGTTPLLPSTSSPAATFTLRDLPEDESLDRRIESNRASLAERYGLSEREREVVGLLIDGYARGDIADALQISPWTVKTHISAIYKKMDIHSNKELMRIVEGRG